MMQQKTNYFLAFFLASLAGVLLHFAHDALPIPPVALVAPISESLWEHVKLVFFPALVAGIILTRNTPKLTLRPWFLSILLGCALMLVIAYFYHVILCADSLIFDIALYFVIMAFIFILAPRFSPPYNDAMWKLIVPITIFFMLIIFTFTFYPPTGALFESPV